MRIRTGKTKNGRLFYVIKTYYDSHGIEHTVTVEKLGNENDIRQRTGRDPDEWAKEYVAQLNEKERLEKQDVTLTVSKTKRITKNHQYSFQVGYLFLQSLYHQLGFPKICKEIQKRHAFEYDLDAILSRLIYGRILQPCSKLATLKFSETLLEKPNFTEKQIYRALDVLAEEADFIQQSLYQNSFALGKRHTGAIYYDCTNFFFEVDQQDEDGLRKYGKSKENRPLPIVEMGMFLDKDGIPLSVCIHSGNTNEQTTLKPIEKKLLQEYNMYKFIVCTDAGLASRANRRFNSVQNRAFIVTQSIKTLSRELKEWALSPDGWKLAGERRKKLYDLRQIDEEKYKESTFYKERWIDRGDFEEKMIVTYSVKYRNYQRGVREGQIVRAQAAIKNGSLKRKNYRQNDYRRLVERITVTADGECAEKEILSLNTKKIQEEAQYDGFYAVCTNLDDDPLEIIKVNRQRWEIEESFRIMKTEFKSRPAYVHTKEHIEAHFLVCFLTLVVYRYLEKRLKEKFTCEAIIHTLREMKVLEVMGQGYIPEYTRTELTDAIHEAFQIHTDYQFISSEDMKKIIKQSKQKTMYAKK